MQQFFEGYHLPALLKASWQAAVLILLVLAVQWAFGRRLSPRWRYGLWLLVVARLALPWTIPSSVSVFNLLNSPRRRPPWLRCGPKQSRGGSGSAVRRGPGRAARGDRANEVRTRRAAVPCEPVAGAARLGGRSPGPGDLPGGHALPALAESHAPPPVDRRGRAEPAGGLQATDGFARAGDPGGDARRGQPLALRVCARRACCCRKD